MDITGLPVVTILARILPSKNEGGEPVNLPPISTVDHPATIAKAVGEMIRAHRPRSEIDLDGRVEIRRDDGASFEEPQTVDEFIPVTDHHLYPRSSLQ